MSEELASVRDAVEHAVKVGRLEPHELAALSKHDEGLTLAQRQEFTEGWRAKGSPAEPAHANPLRVPYYSQRDSGTRHANRMCFSSACAMMLEGMKPGTLSGPNGDDTYLGRVLRYGDTINSESQVKALAFYGITAMLKKNCTIDDIKAQIDQGISAPLGCIHKGNLQNLYGDGHWINAIGYDRTGFVVHDPFGEMDVINGGYINSNGKALRYSFKNFCRRWEVVQAGSSYRYAPGNGWAMIAQPAA